MKVLYFCAVPLGAAGRLMMFAPYGADGRAEGSQAASTGKSRSCNISEELRVILMAPGEGRPWLLRL